MKAPTSVALGESKNSQRFVPADREGFFEAQARNRRATWRMSGLCTIGATLMGIPLALITTPLLYGLVLIAADIVNLFSPLPPEFWRWAEQVARFGAIAVGWLLQGQKADPEALAIGAAVMLLPGIILSLSLWLGLNLMFHRSGTGGALLALQAREPNPTELKELQVADVVEEMAVAAGLPVPKVMLTDAAGANAAALGSTPEDARIVLSRRLIEILNREELEAVIAHLVASIGNGDLRIAVRMTTVLESCGLLVAVINSPFGPRSRGTLRQIVHYCFTTGDPREAAVIADLLTKSAHTDTDDIDQFFDSTGKRSRLRAIRNFIFFPIFFTNTAIKLLLWFFSSAILAPSLALLWHSREYLADASAVQLTRDPDSLAQALQKLDSASGEIPGGDWASRLFMVRPRRRSRDEFFSMTPTQQEVLSRAWAVSAAGAGQIPAGDTTTNLGPISERLPALMRAALGGDTQATARLRSLYQAVTAADPAIAAQFPNPDDLIAAREGDKTAMARLGRFHPRPTAPDKADSGEDAGWMDFHASLKRRLKRLERMGAHIRFAHPDRKPVIVILVLSLILGPFALAAIALFLLLIAVMTISSLAFVVIWLAVIHQLFVWVGSMGA